MEGIGIGSGGNTVIPDVEEAHVVTGMSELRGEDLLFLRSLVWEGQDGEGVEC